MLFRLLLLFILVPFVELWLLLWLADRTSWQHTLVLVIVTGIVGSLLARSQGWRTYTRIQRELAAGHVPGESLVDALMIFVAGALLLTPGILTDVFGLSLLIPFCRRFYRRRLVASFKSRFTLHQVAPGQWTATSGRANVVDCDVVDRSPKGDSQDGVQPPGLENSEE